LRNRKYSFFIPFLMDGALGMMQNAMPLLAIRFGASAWYLATISWLAQGARLPFCFGAGTLSERVGRMRVIIPAALLFLAGTALMGFTRSKEQVLVAYVIIMPCIGAFYPALQAMIGDVSAKGELRKNLSSFNAGWCIGGSLFAVGAGALLQIWQPMPFIIPSIAAFIVVILAVLWSRGVQTRQSQESSSAFVSDIPHVDSLLLIFRIGHFLSFFGLTMSRMFYPKLGVSFGFSEAAIGVITSMLLIGQAAGVFVSGAGEWWRGRIWPPVVSLSMMMLSSLVVCFVSNPVVTSIAFFIIGFALTVIYTGALYYGLHSRRNIEEHRNP
jgi:MFS family permease